MANNKIMVRVKQLILFTTCIIGICSCSRMQNSRYYRYHVGTMKIEKPVLVEFKKQADGWFVCPDSALYCCNDSNWLHRNDVFPYANVIGLDEPVITYFPRKQFTHLAYFMYKYTPCYEYSKKNNYTIHHFYYDLNIFECYMEATDIHMFDYLVDNDIEYSNNQGLYNHHRDAEEFTYRMVVRDKYNIFQILLLKMKHSKPILIDETY